MSNFLATLFLHLLLERSAEIALIIYITCIPQRLLETSAQMRSFDLHVQIYVASTVELDIRRQGTEK